MICWWIQSVALGQISFRYIEVLVVVVVLVDQPRPEWLDRAAELYVQIVPRGVPPPLLPSLAQSVRVHIDSAVWLAARRDTRDSSSPSPGNRLSAQSPYVPLKWHENNLAEAKIK